MNKPLSKQKKTGSKFELQASDTNLYRVSDVSLTEIYSPSSTMVKPTRKAPKKKCGS